MAKIFIDLDNKVDSNAADVAAEVTLITNMFPGVVLKLDTDGNDLMLNGEFSTTPEGEAQYNQIANVPQITRVVEVNHKYTYLHYVDDHGDVRPGGEVVVEAANGGHWSGKVTYVWPSVEEYMQDHDGEPTLVVQEVIDPGPAVTLH